MSQTADLFASMQQRFNPAAATGMDAIFQYDIDEEGSWQVRVADGQCEITQGDAADATVVLSMDTATLSGVMNGEVDGMQAFMTGAIRASGDIMLATRLAALFPPA